MQDLSQKVKATEIERLSSPINPPASFHCSLCIRVLCLQSQRSSEAIKSLQLRCVSICITKYCVCVQDIRRFFGPVSGKPAPNVDRKPDEKKKKKSSSEEDVKKKKKKEGSKARRYYPPPCKMTENPVFPLHYTIFLFLLFRSKAPKMKSNTKAARRKERNAKL